MLDIKNFNAALDQLAEEKGISKEKIIETIEMAIAAAYKKDYGKKTQVVRAKFDPASGKTTFWQIKTVVDESMIKSEEEIAAEEAARAETQEFKTEHQQSREAAREVLEGEKNPDGAPRDQRLRFHLELRRGSHPQGQPRPGEDIPGEDPAGEDPAAVDVRR